MYVGPVPEHLFYAAETIEEAIVMTAKLSMRPNDTNKGRAVKLSHYIDLCKKYYGTMPDDIELYVRGESDLPFTMKSELLEILSKKGWVEGKIGMLDPTLLDRMIRRQK
jgi:acetyl-CoA decarbonylase/synthase complex subunit alpha